MSNFISGIKTNLMARAIIENKMYRLNYFEKYNKVITNDARTYIIDYIEKNHMNITPNFIEQHIFVLSNDINNESVMITDSKLENYIMYLLVMNINDKNIRRGYFFDDKNLTVEGKYRPDTYHGVLDTGKQLNVTLKPIINFMYSETNNIITKLILEKYPMPFCLKFDSFLLIEECEPIVPLADPVVEVFKDLVNQLKSINKNFWLEFIDKESIGKSMTGYGRYFIHNFDSIILKEDKLTSHCVYFDKLSYTKISYKMQIKCILNILSEIYTGTFETKLEPFVEYENFIDRCSDDFSIYDDLILYLMHIKNETG